MSIQSVNPATGEVLQTFSATSPAELGRVMTRAHAAFVEWRGVPFATRAERMRAAARLLRKDKAEHARTMTLEMGKPIVQAEAEVDKCALGCDYYADHAHAFLAEQPRETDASKSYVRFDPLGPVLAVMPWNFPFWQVFRFAAPGLSAGALCHRAARLPGGRLAHRGSARRRRDAHRQRARRQRGGGPGRPPTQEDRARAGRKRPLRGPGGRRSRGGGEGGGGRAARQQRPELHRRQALHRGRGG